MLTVGVWLTMGLSDKLERAMGGCGCQHGLQSWMAGPQILPPHLLAVAPEQVPEAF